MASALEIQHRQVEVDGLSLHCAECGARGRPTVCLVHGWPQDWSAFHGVMLDLARDHHVFAVDLPEIGLSRGAPASASKRQLARHLRHLLQALDVGLPVVVGHDIGGQVVHAWLQEEPETLARAVIMSAAIPGVAPWDEVVRQPSLWHFAFHAVPELPETLVAGHLGEYLDFFFDTFGARRGGVPPQARAGYVAAYARSPALHAAFEWYRAFGEDAQHNAGGRERAIRTPTLYLRGERENGHLDDYLAGMRNQGLRHLHGGVIDNAGHFAPDEQPAAVAEALRRFAAWDPMPSVWTTAAPSAAFARAAAEPAPAPPPEMEPRAPEHEVEPRSPTPEIEPEPAAPGIAPPPAEPEIVPASPAPEVLPPSDAGRRRDGGPVP